MSVGECLICWRQSSSISEMSNGVLSSVGNWLAYCSKRMSQDAASVLLLYLSGLSSLATGDG